MNKKIEKIMLLFYSNRLARLLDDKKNVSLVKVFVYDFIYDRKNFAK
jgi:hypothetical protein